MTRTGFRRWQDAPWAAFGKPGAQTREQQTRLGEVHDQAQHNWFMGFLNRMFDGI
jgi:GMP synthase (glutamine-hydrolysing)